MSHHASAREQSLARVIILLSEKVLQMALDLTKLTAAVERVTAANTAVLAAHAIATDPAVQAQIDALAAKLTDDATKAEAAVAAPPGVSS